MPRTTDSIHTYINKIEIERDAAELKLRRVVGYCIKSRTFKPKELQAAWLRDAILSDVDPMMIITQQLKEEE